jgi:integrase
MRFALADFLAFLAAAGRAPQDLAGRLPPHRHLRHESEPHLWTAEEIRRLLAVIDRQSATGKRDYAMILVTARLGLRICDLRQLELGDLDWRAKTLTIVPAPPARSPHAPPPSDADALTVKCAPRRAPSPAAKMTNMSSITAARAPVTLLTGPGHGMPPG